MNQRCPEGKQCAFQHDRQKFPPSAAAKVKAAKAVAKAKAKSCGAAPLVTAVAAEERPETLVIEEVEEDE